MIKNETNKIYHSNKAVSKSSLFQMTKTPAYYKWYIEQPKSDSADLIFGSAFHKWVLEEEQFGIEFVVSPKFDKRTKEGKIIADEFSKSVEDREIISQEDFDIIKAMKSSIMANPYAKKLLSNGKAEISYYWTDKLTKIRCKCRPDYIVIFKDKETNEIKHIALIDLKSCRSADDRTIVNDCVKYGYDLQSGMYIEGVSNHYGISKENISFIFIFCTKEPPYLINIKEADEFFKQRGENLFRHCIGELKYCRDTNNWYGLNGRDNVPTELGLPAWLVKNEN